MLKVITKVLLFVFKNFDSIWQNVVLPSLLAEFSNNTNFLKSYHIYIVSTLNQIPIDKQLPDADWSS